MLVMQHDEEPPSDARPYRRGRKFWQWPIIVFVTGLLLTGELAWLTWSRSHVRDTARFNNAVQRTTASIESKVAVYMSLLRASVGYMVASPSATADSFHAFAQSIDLPTNFPGVQGIGFAQRVRAEEMSAFLATARARDRERLEILPPGEREEYFPVVFLEPLDRRNQEAIGFDMFSEEFRRTAMVRARDEARPAASRRITLVQEIDSDKQTGFLIYLPVYRGEGIPPTVAERRERLRGFVYSPFRSGDLLGGITTEVTMPQLRFDVFDGVETAPDRLLYRSPVEPPSRPRFSRNTRVPIADRSWTVRFQTTSAFEAGSAQSWSIWVSIGGVLISGMLSAITFALARSEIQSRERGRKLFDQREHLRVTLASIGDAVISADASGRVVFMNGVAEQLTGWKWREAHGQLLSGVFQVVDKQTGEPAPNPVDVLSGHGIAPALANQSVLIAKSGTSVLIEENAAPIRAENGTIVGVVLVFHDVTEKRRAEESLRRSETRKDAILRSALDAIITIDHEGRILESNPAAEEILGHARTDMIGRPLVELIIPARFRIRHERILAHYLTTGEGPGLRRQTELPVLRADGGEFPAELAIVPVLGLQPPMFTVFLRDISQRKDAERQLREAGERFRFMAESMPQKIFTARPNGEFDYFNHQWTEFTGLEADELADGTWRRFVHPDDLAQTLRRWAEALARAEPLQLEHRIRRHDGGHRWHLTRAQALRESSGAVRMWIGSSTEIEDQKRAEERLEKAIAERTAALREINEQLEAFVYTIAHDLRGPLRSITGYSQLLAEDHTAAMDEPGRHLLQRIQHSAEFMDRLILDLLAFGRIARAEIELGPVKVQSAWAIATAQTAAQAEEAQARIETFSPLPIVRAHDATLGQVLANLLSNALKFVAPGVRPQVLFRSEIRGTTARLWLEDNGIGIAPELHDRAFRVFERLHGTRYPGTGIGLSIVRKGVERMGGKVGFESRPGNGTRFWIDLPLSERDADAG